VHPHEMLAELRDDNRALVESMRVLHELCDEADSPTPRSPRYFASPAHSR
jgi:DNA-binding ferritin-like protein